MKAFRLTPRDILFFRDARPMGGSSSGKGGNWPLPSILHSSLLSAFHACWPEGTDWESGHTHLADREVRKSASGVATSMRFGGVRTLGPFPAIGTELFVPTPADLVDGGFG